MGAGETIKPITDEQRVDRLCQAVANKRMKMRAMPDRRRSP